MAKSPKSESKLPPAPDNMIRLFEKAIEAVPGAQVRNMFGYPAAFVNGHMFAGLYDDYMVVRLPKEDLDAFFKLADARTFEPMPGQPMREYGVVPPSVLKSDAELGEWLGKAFDYAKSLPAKPPKKKKA
jgi:TfoX/Sxy family transcriptional regulator of competence genes